MHAEEPDQLPWGQVGLVTAGPATCRARTEAAAGFLISGFGERVGSLNAALTNVF